MSVLPEPYNFIDLQHGGTIVIQVTSFEDGEAVIHPKNVSQRHLRLHMDQYGLTAPPAPGTPISVQVPVLRLYGIRQDEVSPAPYWDISSKTARADLLARLMHGLPLPSLITMTANGAAPLKRYSISTVRA